MDEKEIIVRLTPIQQLRLVLLNKLAEKGVMIDTSDLFQIEVQAVFIINGISE